MKIHFHQKSALVELCHVIFAPVTQASLHYLQYVFHNLVTG